MAATGKHALLALVLLGLAAAPSLVCSVPNTGFVVVGSVFCDTCLAGFETPATTYIAGAKVRVECRDRVTSALALTCEGETDGAGKYSIPVDGEHQNEICESVLVSSPDPTCSTPLAGRERARVVLARNNGVATSKRVANNIGFQRDAAVAGCAEVMKMYQQYED